MDSLWFTLLEDTLLKISAAYVSAWQSITWKSGRPQIQFEFSLTAWTTLCSALRTPHGIFEYKQEKIRENQRCFLNISDLVWHVSYNLTELSRNIFWKIRFAPIDCFFLNQIIFFNHFTMRIKSQITKLAISCIYQLAFGVSSTSLYEFLSKTPWSLSLGGLI